jgi:WD40 repeat protein
LYFPQRNYDVTFSPNGRLLAFASFDGDGLSGEPSVTLWDLEAGQELGILAAGDVIGLAFSPDGKLLATQSPSPGATRIWQVDLDSPETFGQELARLGGSATASEVSTITFLPDNRRILYLGNDLQVKVWDIEGPAQILSFACTSGPVAAAVSPTGTLVAISNVDGAIKLCWLEPTYEWQTITLPAGALTTGQAKFGNVAFSPDGTVIYTAHRSGRLQAWDTATPGLFQPGQELLLIEDLANIYYDVAVSPRGDWLAVSAIDGVYLFIPKQRLSWLSWGEIRLIIGALPFTPTNHW